MGCGLCDGLKIEQTQLLPSVEDREILTQELQRTEAEIADINKAISDIAERIRQAGNRNAQRQAEIEKLRAQQRKLIADANQAEQTKAYESGAERRKLVSELNETKYKIAEAEKAKDRVREKISTAINGYKQAEEQKQHLRDKWLAESIRQYDGSTTCSCCGQPLPESMIEEAKKLFDEAKVKRLEEIQRTAGSIRPTEAEYNSTLETLQTEKYQHEETIITLNNSREDLEARIANLPKDDVPAEVIPSELAGYNELETQIQALEAETPEDTIVTDSSEAYREKRKELEAERDQLRDRLASVATRERYERIIVDLQDEGRQIAQQIADAEREEYTAMQFSIHRVEECERRINGRFQRVSFRLFEYTIADKLKEYPSEVCVPLIDGVPLQTANTASQYSAGMEIVNVLSTFYGVSAPIFIDGRESVQTLPPTDSQIINLVVSDDKELVVTHDK